MTVGYVLFLDRFVKILKAFGGFAFILCMVWGLPYLFLVMNMGKVLYFFLFYLFHFWGRILTLTKNCRL